MAEHGDGERGIVGLMGAGERGEGEYVGEARGPNIIAAALEAYLVALNAMLSEAHWKGAPEAAATTGTQSAADAVAVVRSACSPITRESSETLSRRSTPTRIPGPARVWAGAGLRNPGPPWLEYKEKKRRPPDR